jgi:hypothetical protein
MKWLDLFSGCGMYALGLEQAGHEVIGFCEVDKFCHKLLKKHWPTKPISWSIELLNKALMESSGVSPVRIFHQQQVPEFPETVQDCSGRWLKPFAWYDHNTGLWRTWQHYIEQTGNQTLAPYLEPWPSAGVMQNGIAYQREALAHHTTAPEHTFLATPLATEKCGAHRPRYKGSKNLPLSRTSETLRICEDEELFLDPSFAEIIMGLPKDFTLLETETPLA